MCVCDRCWKYGTGITSKSGDIADSEQDITKPGRERAADKTVTEKQFIGLSVGKKTGCVEVPRIVNTLCLIV